ncbi:uncharacterized protein LOC121750203 isoform X2 [Salvia splendens]|uniref:uncharacterized protein LOC121750203 isoform X2 n=1 Tax=Salvia splendens TaxID=180675 RepID=UPI001C26697F|nr:uncharacterized protein LOC121750203 isoform X2 [Salvia splendens]
MKGVWELWGNVAIQPKILNVSKFCISRLGADGGEEFFASYDEVYDSFKAMGLQAKLLSGLEKPSEIHVDCGGVHVVVGAHIKMFALDVADEMLSLGFNFQGSDK